jgi:hypothetical protein
MRTSRSSGKVYYRNEALQITQWDRPVSRGDNIPPSSEASAKRNTTAKLTKEQAETEFANFMNEMGSLSLGKETDTAENRTGKEPEANDIGHVQPASSNTVPAKQTQVRAANKKAMLQSAESHSAAW